MTATAKKSADEMFAETIISMLKAGTAPWQKEWSTGEAQRSFYNVISNAEYRGANIVRLFISSHEKGFEDPRWMTYKQAQDKGWQVRKGEKGTAISFFSPYKKQFEGEDGEEVVISRFARKTYTVFNAAQVDGVEALPTPKAHEWTPVEAGEKVLAASKADIRYDGGNRAYYSPKLDIIHLPERSAFPDEAYFYATALHELAHWTGHESRLDRRMEDRFGVMDYAREELRAEIASWMIAVATGLPHHPENAAAYVGAWVKNIENDYREIFKACADAEKIKAYVLGLAAE